VEVSRPDPNNPGEELPLLTTDAGTATYAFYIAY